MMRMAVCLVAASAATMALTPGETDFKEWMVKHDRTYASDPEYQQRLAVYLANVKYVETFKRDTTKTYTVALNQFADLSPSEFKEMYLSPRPAPTRRQTNMYVPRTKVGDLPLTVDWRTQGYVTPIKDQGQCGSCWAFSAIASLEGQNFARNGTLTSLSEMELVDCSSPQGNLGCDGGLQDWAFDYIETLPNGISTEASYPYKDHAHKHCTPGETIGATVSSYVDIPSKNETALEVACADVGPISVAIDASQDSFQFYERGVYNEFMCESDARSLDHGVTVVGYGHEGPERHPKRWINYWTIKNSWGTGWGERGYMRMEKGFNRCGIATQASYPII